MLPTLQPFYPQMRSSLCLPSCLAWCPTGHGTENGKSEQVSYLSPMCGSREQLGESQALGGPRLKTLSCSGPLKHLCYQWRDTSHPPHL